MIKYCKQLHKFDCGPMAAFNILRWSGKRVCLKKDYPKIKRACFWDSRSGIDIFDLQGFLDRQAEIKATRIWECSLDRMNDALDNGKVLVMLYVKKIYGQDQGHFVLIHSRTEQGYIVANEINENGEQGNHLVTYEEMQSRIHSRERGGNYWQPKIIEITRR